MSFQFRREWRKVQGSRYGARQVVRCFCSDLSGKVINDSFSDRTIRQKAIEVTSVADFSEAREFTRRIRSDSERDFGGQRILRCGCGHLSRRYEPV